MARPRIAVMKLTERAAGRERGGDMDGLRRLRREQTLDLGPHRGSSAVFVKKPLAGNRFQGSGGIVQLFGGLLHP